MNESTENARPPARRLGTGLGLVALAVAGALLAVQPHLSARVRTGDPTYIPDSDGLLYQVWSRAAVLHDANHLVDGVRRPSGPMMHPWPLFVPAARLTHALGLGPSGVGVVWRVLAGAGIALGLYAAVRPATRDPRVALGVAAFVLFDPGFLFGQLARIDVELLVAAARGSDSFFKDVPRVMAHLRVVTPALALPVLLVHYGLALRARQTGSLEMACGAAASFGLLFYVYFYFWTVVMVGTALAFVLDPPGRRVWALVLGGGLLLGLPAVVSSALVKASTPPDWLHRTDKFVKIGHFQELLFPKLVIAEWLATAWFVFTRRRELTYLWCCTGAALVCLNHQVVSGLQIENFHWVAPLGVTFSVLLAVLIAPWAFERRRWGLKLLGVLVIAQMAFGFVARHWETTRTRETRHWERVYHQIQDDVLPIPPGAVTAGDPDYLLLVAALGDVYPLFNRLVEFSSLTTDAELDERLVLNLYLLGTDKKEAQRLVALPAGTLSWEAEAQHSPAVADRQQARRLDLIERVWRDPETALERLDVTAIVVPTQLEGTDRLSALARRVRQGPHRELWLVGPR